jgi:hypothetical protein
MSAKIISYFVQNGRPSSFSAFLIIAICSIFSYGYGEAIRDYFSFTRLKIHWIIFVIYFLGAMVLMEVAFESKWIKIQSKFIRYFVNIIMCIYCAPLLIVGFTVVFGSFIEVPINIIISILYRILYYLSLIIHILSDLIKLFN